MTIEKQKAYVAALLRERAAYELAGNAEGAAAVDAELRRLGAAGKAPAKRAEKRAK